MEKEIVDSYNDLNVSRENIERGTALDILKNASEPLFVAVRSSATTEDLETASFAGQQETFLNIKGEENLIKHIKKAFASLFTSRATYYRNKKGFDHMKSKLAVIVQKMVDSDKSGVIFSRNPSNPDDQNIIIEAVLGLGEGIVSGMITPDKYILDRDFQILDKKIANKKIALTRDSSGAKKQVRLSEEKSNCQVLKESEMISLSEIAEKLEDHYKKPQDIEFAIENGEIFIVQTRAITTIQKKSSSLSEIKGEPILEGMGASPGVDSGKVKVIKDLGDLSKIQKGDVLVTGMTNPDMVVSMQKCAAIITDEGGLTAHASIVSREMGIPAVVGTQNATEKLKDNDIVTVDGSSGKVFLGKVAESEKKGIKPVERKTKTELKVIIDLPSFAERASKTNLKKVGLLRIEGIIAESRKHPEYFLKNGKTEEYEEIIFRGINEIAKYFEEIWVRTSDIRSDEFANLEGAPEKKEANPMLGFHGIRYGLKNPEILKAELRAMKRASEKARIGVLISQLIDVEELKKTKEYIKGVGFTNAQVGVMIETPSAVQEIKNLCDEGIDFISFGTNDLTQYILAVDRGNSQVQQLYNEMHPSVLYQIDYVLRVAKRNGVQTSICGQAASKKPMVKFLLERGIDSISVNADSAKDISDYLLEIEKGNFSEENDFEEQALVDVVTRPEEQALVDVVTRPEEQALVDVVTRPEENYEEQALADIVARPEENYEEQALVDVVTRPEENSDLDEKDLEEEIREYIGEEELEENNKKTEKEENFSLDIY
jgi:pyruvate,water dikinase